MVDNVYNGVVTGVDVKEMVTTQWSSYEREYVYVITMDDGSVQNVMNWQEDKVKARGTTTEYGWKRRRRRRRRERGGAEGAPAETPPPSAPPSPPYASPVSSRPSSPLPLCMPPGSPFPSPPPSPPAGAAGGWTGVGGGTAWGGGGATTGAANAWSGMGGGGTTFSGGHAGSWSAGGTSFGGGRDTQYDVKATIKEPKELGALLQAELDLKNQADASALDEVAGKPVELAKLLECMHGEAIAKLSSWQAAAVKANDYSEAHKFAVHLSLLGAAVLRGAMAEVEKREQKLHDPDKEKEAEQQAPESDSVAEGDQAGDEQREEAEAADLASAPEVTPQTEEEKKQAEKAKKAEEDRQMIEIWDSASDAVFAYMSATVFVVST